MNPASVFIGLEFQIANRAAIGRLRSLPYQRYFMVYYVGVVGHLPTQLP